jgi:hypothetical protein
MRYESDAAEGLAVALVTAMIDRFDVTDESADGRLHAARIAQMITDARLSSDVAPEEYISALGLLGACAVQDVSTWSGEPIALWLSRWLSDAYGSPRDRETPPSQ